VPVRGFARKRGADAETEEHQEEREETFHLESTSPHAPTPTSEERIAAALPAESQRPLEK